MLLGFPQFFYEVFKNIIIALQPPARGYMRLMVFFPAQKMSAVAINVNNLFIVLFQSFHSSLYLCSLAIFAWGLARLRLEKADEVLRILKAETLAYLRDAEGFICKQLAGSHKQSVVYHTLGCSASLCLDQFTEIFGRIAAFVGKVGYGRQTLTLRFPGNVFIEQRDELLYHRMINLLACDKLAVVEAQAVVQQQLDV